MGLKSGSKSGKGIKQGATKLGVGKSTSKSSSKQSDSDDEPDIDTSVMRPSIEISVSTVPQLVRAYQAATEELKSILTKECDIIYECRVCRNLFRSLANMMAHKRVYCKAAYCYSKHSSNRNKVREDYTVVIQPEPVPSNSQENWTTSDKVPDCSNESSDDTPQIIATTSRISSLPNPKKGLREIVDRLARNTSENSTSSKETKCSSTKLCDNANVLGHASDKTEHSFQLEDIETSKVGKFQTKLVSTVGAEKEDLMKAQVSELQHMASQNEAVLGPDGKMIISSRHSSHAAMKSSVGKNSEACADAHEQKSIKDEHVCPDCKVKFSTRKTLNHHMKSLHVTFRLCYPCPCCKSTFVNPWSVYRHLYKVHRKTAAQVRRLRPQIQKKAFKKEIHNEIPVPETSSKNEALKELQRLDQENQAWMDNFEDDLELQRCGGCGRRFERRAALNSHSQICQKRIAARNNVKVSRNLSTSTSPDKITKVSPADEHSLAIEPNKKPNNVNKSIDVGNNTTNTSPASRTHQVASWTEQPKKEIPEKKIEIQIRKDYYKMSSASSVVALDTQSETDSRPPSPIAEDEYSYDGDLRDWESMIGMEQVNKVESESDYPLFRDAQASSCTNDDVGEDEAILYNNSPESVREPAVELNSCISVLNRYSPKKDKFGTHKRPENLLKRRVSNENRSLSDSVNSESSKRRRQSLGNENINKDLNKNLSSKNKKLEQFHPIMEARMKKLINLRRLQCLICQKKFIKLTNLRRHVAVHIDWCRYKCMLCSFKCFSKYDCVDHVCKIHLKGTQRGKAATMVENIEEQESESLLDSEQIEDLNDSFDHGSNTEEAHEPLSMEINSLNLEDIKNIVGVTCYPDVVLKSEVSSVTSVSSDENHRSNICSSENVKENDTSLLSNEDKCEIKAVNTESMYISEWNSMTTEDKKSLNDPEVTLDSEIAGKEEKCEDLVSNKTTNVQDETLKKEDVLLSENLNKFAIDDKSVPNAELEPVEPFSEELIHNDTLTEIGSCEDIIADKSDVRANISDDESTSKDSFNVCNDRKLKDPVLEYFASDEKTSDTPQVSVVEELQESDELVPENENFNDDEFIRTEFQARLQASEVECVLSEEELESSDHKSAVVEENTLTSDDVGDHDYAMNKERDVEKILDESLDSSDGAPNNEKDEIALRKMVMEVIFGSGGTSDSHSDPNQNVISAPINGAILDEDNSEGGNSRASSASGSEVVTSNHVPSTLKVSKRKNEIECGPGIEFEKRERPVRNRVKVEKEGFIYEFSDSFLKKEESSKVGAHISGSRKKHGDSGKEGVKNDFTSDHNRSTSKAVPKLTLVRTDKNEIPGNKRMNGPVKGSWSSVYASATDSAGSKTYSEPNSQTCSSSRKLPRTYDVKQ